MVEHLIDKLLENHFPALAIISFGLAAFLMHYDWRDYCDEYKRTRKYRVWDLMKLIGSTLFVALGFLIFSVYIAVTYIQVVPKLTEIFGLSGMRLVICILVVGLGFFAYRWKQSNQRTYGMGEAIFGIWAGIFITFTLAPDQSFLSQWVGLGGAAYIIARGLNNIAEAKTKHESGLKAKARSSGGVVI